MTPFNGRSTVQCCDVDSVQSLLELPRELYTARDGLHAIEDVEQFVLHNPYSYFTVSLRLLGGKGGFGTLLRSFRINKSTNQRMCRDLNGRRMVDVEEEKKLKKWIENASEREKAKMEKKKAKYEKLKAATADKPKHDFNDPDYIQTREDILDKADDAFEAGFEELRKNKKRKPEKKKVESSDSDSDFGDLPGPSNRKKAKKVKKSEVSVQEHIVAKTSVEETIVEKKEDQKEKSERLRKEWKKSEEEKKRRDEEEEKSKKQEEEERKRVEAEKAKEAIPKDFPSIDLDAISAVEELEALGLHHLKHALEARGLKCGGSLQERATRLFSIRGLSPDKFPKNILAPKKK